MKKSFLILVMMGVLITLSLAFSGCKDEVEYKTSFQFVNNSSYDANIEITDSGWTPKKFTIKPNGSRTVRHEEQKTSINYSYGPANLIKVSSGNPCYITDK